MQPLKLKRTLYVLNNIGNTNVSTFKPQMEKAAKNATEKGNENENGSGNLIIFVWIGIAVFIFILLIFIIIFIIRKRISKRKQLMKYELNISSERQKRSNAKKLHEHINALRNQQSFVFFINVFTSV